MTPNSKKQVIYICKTYIFILTCQVGKIVKLISKVKDIENITIHYFSQKMKNLEKAKQSYVGYKAKNYIFHTSQEVKDANELTISHTNQ